MGSGDGRGMVNDYLRFEISKLRARRVVLARGGAEAQRAGAGRRGWLMII